MTPDASPAGDVALKSADGPGSGFRSPQGLVGRLYLAASVGTWSLIVLWAVSSLWYPFGWDQGIIAWVASVVVDGGMPYRDAFDLKGPVAYLIFALPQALFGHNLWGIRVLDVVGIGVSAWLVGRHTARGTDREGGVWAAALLILWFAGLTYWHTAQPDGFAAMLLCVGILPLIASGGASYRRTLWAGVAIGATVGIKPTYAAFLLVPIVFLVMNSRGQPRRVLTHVGLLVGGAATLLGVVLAWFAMKGALDSLVEVHLAYNAQAYSSGASFEVGQRLRGVVEYVLQGELFVVLLPAALLGLYRLALVDRALAWTIGTWALLAFGNVVVQNKFFDYQWIPMFPPVVILSVVGLRSAMAWACTDARSAETEGKATLRDRGSFAPGIGHALFVVILVHAWAQPTLEAANWATYVTGLRDKQAYYDTFGVPGADLRMAEYITENSAESDHVLVLGWNLEILYMTERPTVSRLAFSLPVWMGDGTPLRERYRAELMSDLRSEPPELIVVAEQAEPLIGRPVSLGDFGDFRDLLSERYAFEVDFGPLKLYRAIPPTSLP